MNLPNHDPQITKCYWRCLNFHCYIYHVSHLHIYTYLYIYMYLIFILFHFSLFLFHLVLFSIIDLVRDAINISLYCCWYCTLLAALTTRTDNTATNVVSDPISTYNSRDVLFSSALSVFISPTFFFSLGQSCHLSLSNFEKFSINHCHF